MAETGTDPFIHPARQRLAELIDQAEEQILEEQAAAPAHNPLERYTVAEEWGVEPWVAAMIEASRDLAKLKMLAVSALSTPGEAAEALIDVTSKTLQAAVLAEEADNADAVLDDSQLAGFLEKLAQQLDQRIEKLKTRSQPFDGTHPHTAFQPPEQVRVPLLDEEDDDHTEHVHAAFPVDEPAETVGLAFTGPHGAVVAGEGPLADPPAQVAGSESPDPWSTPEVAQRSEEFLGKDPIQPQEVDPAVAEQSHDFIRESDVPEDEVDLDAAERALARESAALRLTAADSSARQLGGRHASPADTDPDMGATGRRARGEHD